ncbi:MAG: CUB domain-containing protein [Flavobacteriales bacterium]|nr:CUB domain-containing protein [Flavobacteriales bacterium]
MSIHSNVGAFPIIANTCDDDGCAVAGGHASVIFNPTVTTTYRGYFYVGACGAGNETGPGQTVNFRVTYLGPVPAPANDEPCSATPIGPLVLPFPNGCTVPFSGTTVGATNSVGNGLGAGGLVPTSECTAPAVQYNGGDVWFQVPVPPSGLLGIATTDGGVCAGGFALYTAAVCGGPYTMLAGSGVNTGLCAIEGVSAPSGSDAGVVIDGPALGLIPGQMVYIRYWERNNNENGTFTICAYEPIPPPNDNPCGALVIPTALTCTPVEYTTENATLLSGVTANPANTCVGPVATSDVWFAVVVPPSGAMTIEASAGTLTDMAMSWYRFNSGAICGPGTFNQIGCDNNGGPGNMPRINSQTAGIALVVGETIYVRLWNQPDNLYGTFSICAVENIPPPNDNPCGAINLDVTPSCEPTVGTTESASPTPNGFTGGTIMPPYPVCGSGPGTDVWYSLTVPNDLIAPYGISFETTAGILLDGAFQIYTATGGCATSNLVLTPVGACTPNAGGMPNLTLNIGAGISAGQQVYVRVWRQSAPDGNFGICAVRTDPIPCIGSATDPLGPTVDYVNNTNDTQTYCSSKAGDVVTLTFSQFILENNWDYLYIYDGPTTASPLIGTYTGSNSQAL